MTPKNIKISDEELALIRSTAEKKYGKRNIAISLAKTIAEVYVDSSVSYEVNKQTLVRIFNHYEEFENINSSLFSMAEGGIKHAQLNNTIDNSSIQDIGSIDDILNCESLLPNAEIHDDGILDLEEAEIVENIVSLDKIIEATGMSISMKNYTARNQGTIRPKVGQTSENSYIVKNVSPVNPKTEINITYDSNLGYKAEASMSDSSTPNIKILGSKKIEGEKLMVSYIGLNGFPSSDANKIKHYFSGSNCKDFKSFKKGYESIAQNLWADKKDHYARETHCIIIDLNPKDNSKPSGVQKPEENRAAMYASFQPAN